MKTLCHHLPKFKQQFIQKFEFHPFLTLSLGALEFQRGKSIPPSATAMEAHSGNRKWKGAHSALRQDPLLDSLLDNRCIPWRDWNVTPIAVFLSNCERASFLRLSNSWQTGPRGAANESRFTTYCLIQEKTRLDPPQRGHAVCGASPVPWQVLSVLASQRGALGTRWTKKMQGLFFFFRLSWNNYQASRCV